MSKAGYESNGGKNNLQEQKCIETSDNNVGVN